jgi:hypothetical protein
MSREKKKGKALWGFSEKQSKEEQKSKALWGIHLKIKTRAPDGFGMGCGGVCGGGSGNYVGRWWVFGEGSSKKVLKDDVVVEGGFLVLEGGKIDLLPDLFHGFGRS